MTYKRFAKGVAVKKILQFAIASSQGGYTQYITNIWRSIDKSKIHFDFVTFSKTVDFAQEFIKNGCRVYQITAYPEENMQVFICEFEQILENDYDAIEIHTSFWKNTIVEKLSKQKGVKVIIHAHSTGISKARNAREEAELLEKHLNIKEKINEKLADYYLACSSEAAKWLYGEAIPEDKIRIINNTIDSQRFSFNEEIRRNMREKLRLQDKFVIGHVGRLERVKNQKFLLEIFAEVRKKIENAVLLILGDGSLKECLQEQAEMLDITDSVIFVGKRMDTELYYQVMDIFVLPSFLEGFPIALLEAQCSGLNCLCSETITREACITNSTKRISLNNPYKWIEEIEKAAKVKVFDRNDNSKLIEAKGFDTEKQMKYIEELYIGI